MSQTSSLSASRESRSSRFERSLLVLFVLSLPFINPWIHGDGVGYYAYARAPLIQHDLDFTRDYQAANQAFRELRLNSEGQPRAEFFTSTGHLSNHFTVGPAILWSPFLLCAHAGVLLARAFGSSVSADGFSAPYRYAMALATAGYGFLGLLFSFRLARRYFDSVWAFWATLAVWWASALPVYMYFNPAWSHAHSAFAAALFLWYWDLTRSGRTRSQWIVLGLIAGLMLNVYYPNLMLLAVLLIEFIHEYRETLRTAKPPRPKLMQLLSNRILFGAVVSLALVPTFLSRWVIYGGPFETGYVSIRDYLWRTPALFEVLFSANHGLFSWTPLLAVSVIGLFLAVRWLPEVAIPFCFALFAFYIFLALYPDWNGISSYGNRFFISLTPIFIFGLAAMLQTVAALFANRRTAVLACSPVLCCFVLWNLGLIYQWGNRMIPARGPISFRQAAHNEFHVIPGQIASRFRSYFLERGDLLQEIEQHDLKGRPSPAAKP